MNISPPSHWVSSHLQLLRPHSRVLDLACGNGRHTRLLHSSGHSVVAVDLDLAGVTDLTGTEGIELRQLDLEASEWPLQGECFDGIVVTNYLYRPFLPALIDNLADDGVLIYATFATGNEKFGRPSDPNFLLNNNELQDVFGAELHVLTVDHSTGQTPRPAVRQRICALGRNHPAAK